MDFADKLIALRRAKGLSQEMLADTLGVSRQAVSKWEAGRALPDVPKLVLLADTFGVSLDELVRDAVAPAPAEGPIAAGPLVTAASMRYEYKSKANLFGIPLVHVCLGRLGPRGVAKGIIAVGDIAIGAVAMGGIAVGGVAVGGLSAGLLLAIGGLAVGGVALGGLALGVLAFGGIAIGAWAMGGLAVAGQVAAGGLAVGPVAMGGKPMGELTFTSANLPATFEAFKSQVLAAAPKTPGFLLRLFYLLAGG